MDRLTRGESWLLCTSLSALVTVIGSVLFL
jgi:hypothetical protein